MRHSNRVIAGVPVGERPSNEPTLAGTDYRLDLERPDHDPDQPTPWAEVQAFRPMIYGGGFRQHAVVSISVNMADIGYMSPAEAEALAVMLIRAADQARTLTDKAYRDR